MLLFSSVILTACEAEKPLSETPPLPRRIELATVPVPRPRAAPSREPRRTSPRWPADNFPISVADLNFGRRQVKAMMRDRPAMATLVAVGDPMFEWTARRFGGASCGSRIVWRNEEPSDGFPADHQSPGLARPGQIRVSRWQRAHKLWNGAVFELFNISHSPEFRRLFEQAWTGTIDRFAFVENVAYEEYLASQTMQSFYLDAWCPYGELRGIDPHWEPWYPPVCSWTDYKNYCKPDTYPNFPYGRDYDLMVKARRERTEYAQYVERSNYEVEEHNQAVTRWNQEQMMPSTSPSPEQETDDGVADIDDYMVRWRRRQRAARKHLPLDPTGGYPVRTPARLRR